MNFSAKDQYAIVSLIELASNYDGKKKVSLIEISQKLNISKIYLEQVFSLLRKNKIVNSVKGAYGGYYLARPANKITVWDILEAINSSVITKQDIISTTEPMEQVLESVLTSSLHEVVYKKLSEITLENLLSFVIKQKTEQAFMMNI